MIFENTQKADGFVSMQVGDPEVAELCLPVLLKSGGGEQWIAARERLQCLA